MKLNKKECHEALLRLLKPYFTNFDVQEEYYLINPNNSFTDDFNLLTRLIMKYFDNKSFKGEDAKMITEEERDIINQNIIPYKNDIKSIARCTDYLREFLDIRFKDGEHKYVWLPNSHCFPNTKLCTYYSLEEFLERVEYEEGIY